MKEGYLEDSWQESIDTWLQALEVERMEQQETFRLLLQSQSVHERVKAGFTWYPLNILSNGFAMGSIPYVLVSKTKEHKQDDKFQAGRPVQIFQMQTATAEKPIRGIIHWLNKTEMKIYLHAKEIPHWLYQSSIGVDVLYDEQSFIDMKNAMMQLRELRPTNPSKKMASLLYKGPSKDANFKYPTENYVISDKLNDSQTSAVKQALSAELLHIIHGPPGTGKTTTLVALTKALLQTERQILVCAPSNAAVDWITALLHKSGIKTIRIGHLSRIDNEVLECSLESVVYSRSEAKDLKRIRIKAQEIKKVAGQYKRSFGHEERLQRKALNKEAREMFAWADELENRLIDETINNAQVICCTLTGTSNKYIKDRRFSVCIIDEAAQALQGACWMAMLKADKVILAGDPFQLPPTVKSMEAVKKGLGVTLLDLAVELNLAQSLLQEQYRMNRVIMQFSNIWFYKGALKAHKSVVNHSLDTIEKEMVLEFIDTAGCGFSEQLKPESKSYYNPDEYRLLREHLDGMLTRHWPDSQMEIGIISPYKAQVEYVKDMFLEEPFPEAQLSIQTIDGFQGQERDIIYISLVRSNDKQEIGFLKDYRRMNVAMTRARKKLIIIGDSSCIGNDLYYKALLDYIDEQQSYRSAWEFMYQGNV